MVINKTKQEEISGKTLENILDYIISSAEINDFLCVCVRRLPVSLA